MSGGMEDSAKIAQVKEEQHIKLDRERARKDIQGRMLSLDRSIISRLNGLHRLIHLREVEEDKLGEL